MSESEYQELLAAMLSMVSIDVMCGDTRTCKLHLGACEALIKTRTKDSDYQLSPLSKALHTTFIYLRLMQKAASVSRTNDLYYGQSPNFLAPDAVNAAESLTTSDLSSIIGLDGSSDPQLDSFSSEMIYGFPPDLLSLLSKTIDLTVRLASNVSGSEDLEFIAGMHRERDQLEDLILDWPVDDFIARYQASSLSSANRDILVHYTHAFHQALIIFFHDKVLSTRSRLLQRYVYSVIFHLEQIEIVKMENGIVAGPLLWPAFIAACQATKIADQNKFISWLNESDKIGVGTSKATIELLRQFWTTSEEPGQCQATLARSHIELVLT